MKNINLLIVDDEEYVGAITKDTCEDWGYNCSYMSNSQDALEYFRQNPIHIVILDIDLKEELTGVDLIPKFKEINPDVIIIMLTGENDINIGIQAMRAGAYDYHLKPFDYEYMEQRLKFAVDKHNTDKLRKMYINAMVHDLKSPLASMSCVMDGIGIKTKSDEKISRYTKLGHQTIKDMKSMILNILNLEKMTTGKYKLKTGQFNIRECLQEVVYSFCFLSSPLKVSYEDISDDFDIITDKELYKHVLNNLVSNARRYSTDIEITIRKNNGHLETSVKNVGSFIPEEQKSRIFEPFIQSENDTKVNEHNFGFGLSFCQAAVNCMDGEIKVESDEESLTTVFTYSVAI